MTSELHTTLKFVHRANIGRYRRILATYLTDKERRFVERRLAEEQASLDFREVLTCPRVDELSTQQRGHLFANVFNATQGYGSHIAARSSPSVYVGLALRMKETEGASSRLIKAPD